jgi:hypothetical protein
MNIRSAVAVAAIFLGALAQQAYGNERPSPAIRMSPIGRSVPLLYVPYGQFGNYVHAFRAGVPAAKLLETIPTQTPYSVCVDAKRL